MLKWRILPIRLAIMKVLEKRDGLILESELRLMVEKEIGEISSEDLDRELMNLEVYGKILVSQIKKTERKITSLKKNEHRYLPIGED